MCINSFNTEAMETREALVAEQVAEQEERTLDFDEFCETVKAMMMVKYPDAEVTVHEVCKEGGLLLHGILIKPEGVNVSPTIYLESFYKAYENGEISLSEAVEKTAELYEEHKMPETFDMSWFMDWENVKDQVVVKLINKESNKELLKKIPHIDFLDETAVIFKVLMPEDNAPDNTMATVTITNDLLSSWNVTTDIVREAALANSPKLLPMKLQSMFDTIDEIRRRNPLALIPELPEIPDDGPQMMVLSNIRKCDGASVILYPKLLKKIGEKYGDFVLIPSSIHEVLIVTNTSREEMPTYNGMVKDVNRTAVASNEVLADRAYYYDSTVNELQIVA